MLANKEKKIILLNNMNLDSNILTPIKTVSNHNEIVGYTQEFIWPHKTFDDLTDCVLELGKYDAEGKYVYCV